MKDLTTVSSITTVIGECQSCYSSNIPVNETAVYELGTNNVIEKTRFCDLCYELGGIAKNALTDRDALVAMLAHLGNKLLYKPKYSPLDRSKKELKEFVSTTLTAWHNRTKFLSGGFETHVESKMIADKGLPAVPYLMEYIDTYPHHVIAVLGMIVPAPEISPYARGIMSRIISTWKRHIIENGYLET